MIERICLEYAKKLRDDPAYHQKFTTLIEFSRGTQHGGYTSAFQHLSRDVVQQLAVLYIDVPWEESLRKNRKRFNPNKPDSILEHALPDDKLERLYKETDWEQVSAGNPETLAIQGSRRALRGLPQRRRCDHRRRREIRGAAGGMSW